MSVHLQTRGYPVRIFSARTRDFITAIDDTGIIIIRELQSTETYEDLESIAYMLVDMLNTEAMTSAWVAYSNLASTSEKLPRRRFCIKVFLSLFSA